MPEKYFEIPFFKKLTSVEGWDKQNSLGTHYHVARAFFQLNVRQLPGPANIGKKFDVLGHAEGMTTQRIKTMEVETEVFQQVDTIKTSIVESEFISKIINQLTTSFGDGKIFKLGGKISTEGSSKIKESFTNEFQITNSTRKRELVRYEFTDTLPSDFKDRVCGVEVYQKCAAELYLIKIDFLNIKYEKTMFGLRKKIRKYPFPESSNSRPPNVIKIGAPLATLQFWQLLPQSSLMIKDEDYCPEVIDDSEITITSPLSSIKDRPYWSVQSPSLYQLSNVVFPYKWVNKTDSEYSKEELMEMELGEAEGSAWWFINGPGRQKKS